MSLQLSGISKSFGTLPVLDDVTIDVERGSRLAIVGASGSGKSTMLRIIAGFERPTAGEVRLDDRVLASPTAMISAHRRGIGYVAQDGALFPHLTVRGNIAFALRRGPRRAARVREVLDLVSLDPELLERFPHQLSGGQQQRVALARALAPNPQVILLDEPFSALDTGLRVQTRAAMVAALERSGVTTILVTHDQDEALSFGQQIAVIADGRLVQAGAPSHVFDRPASASIAEFLGSAIFVPAERHSDSFARCRLGSLRVRCDFSNGTEPACAMLRPSQVRLDAAPHGDERAGASIATVTAVRQAGSEVEVTLSGHASEPYSLTHRLPSYEADTYTVGSEVTVRIDGGVVLYPAETDAPRAAFAAVR